MILALNNNEFTSEQGNNACNDSVAIAIREILGETYKISMSTGKYVVYTTSETLEYMIDCAHSARTLGKQKYGNTSFEFTQSMRIEKTTKNQIVNTMEDALENKEFKIFYQPKVELKGAKLIGAEALVRWFPPNGSIIFPDNFIPLFEKNGFILSLDYYIFEEVCSYISKHRDILHMPTISINLSAITLLDDMLVTKLTAISKRYHVDNSILEIELTESAIVKDYEEAIKKIDLLKKAGFIISLDDFGSGQSSLNRLKDLHIDILKIDREFLTASLTEVKGISIIKNVINMAKEINILTIAEGVETKEHVQFLQDLDCDYAQGYYFGKPMNEEDFKKIVGECSL